MRKIKKFKVAIHLKEILRRVKSANIDMAAAGFPNESDLAVFIASLHEALRPGVVYEFVEGQCLELSSAGLAMEGQFSICAVTLGEEIEKAVPVDNMQAAAAANIVIYDFLRTAVNFIADLIKEDAAKEECLTQGYELLYAPAFSYGPLPKFLREAPKAEAEKAKAALPAVFERLNASKINVTMEDGQVKPKATIVFIMPWYKKKGKK